MNFGTLVVGNPYAAGSGALRIVCICPSGALPMHLSAANLQLLPSFLLPVRQEGLSSSIVLIEKGLLGVVEARMVTLCWWQWRRSSPFAF